LRSLAIWSGPQHPALADTVAVSVTVLHVERVAAGRLLALAEVEVEISGVAFTLHGVRVIKTGPRSRGIAAPCYRVANGRLADAISLPPELTAAVAGAVLDEYDALRRMPPRAAPRGAGIAGGGIAATFGAQAPNARQRAP
jgi:hypothetical protein